MGWRFGSVRGLFGMLVEGRRWRGGEMVGGGWWAV